MQRKSTEDRGRGTGAPVSGLPSSGSLCFMMMKTGK